MEEKHTPSPASLPQQGPQPSTAPSGAEGDFTFSELVDTASLQQMMDRFYRLTGLPIGIIDTQDRILVATGWQELCTRFHRTNPETCKRCIESDHYIAKHLSEGRYVEYRCQNGLWELAQPIVIEGLHVATIFLGQFLFEDEEPDEGFFENQALEFGFEREAYLKAYRDLPVFSRHKVHELMGFYMQLAGFLSAQGLATRRLRQEVISRTQAERALSERERELLTLLGNLPGMAYRCRNDLDWTMEFVSHGCLELTGYGAHELQQSQGVPYAGLIHPDDRQGVWDAVQASLERREHFLLEYRILPRGGGEKWVWEKGCGVFAPDGELTSLEGFIIDITAQRLFGETLRESEEKYRRLIQSSTDAIFLLYRGRLEVVNDTFLKLFGLSEEEVRAPGFDLLELCAPASRDFIRERFNRLEQGEAKETRYEFTALTRKGQALEIEASLSFLRYKDGLAVQGILRDVTERQHLERQLVQAQKMESIGTLAGGIAHDFNNILTVINGHAELALKKNPPENPCCRDMQAILQAGRRAEALTRQLLAFSRRQASEARVVVLNDLIAATDKLLKRLIGEDIAIEMALDPDTPPVRADPGQIEQILMNLAVNARDAIHDLHEPGAERRITVATGQALLDDAFVSRHMESLPGPHALITVSDTGVGMAPEIVDQIFDPFFTTKARGKGTGLGLSTVYGIVKQNAGSIAVTSAPGEGTSIRIYWPATREQVRADSEPPDTTPAAGGETVLVVEDDEAVRAFTVSALEQLGYRVLEAASGEEALALFEKTGPGAVDLLLTDLIMPGIDGLELAARLSDWQPGLKVLYASGYTNHQIVPGGPIRPGINFIQKPFSLQALAQRIRTILDARA